MSRAPVAGGVAAVYEGSHLEFAAGESAALADDTAWSRWCIDAERLIGGGLDGDETENGYSLDGAYDAYSAGRSAAQYAATVKARPNFAARLDQYGYVGAAS